LTKNVTEKTPQKNNKQTQGGEGPRSKLQTLDTPWGTRGVTFTQGVLFTSLAIHVQELTVAVTIISLSPLSEESVVFKRRLL
jgi:hypothetical protein